MAAITLQTARNAFGRLKKDITDVSQSDFVDWCNFVSRFAYREIVGADPERFVSTSSYTVSAAPSTQALPADFENIQPLGCGVFEVDNDGKDTIYQLARTGFGRRDPGYYITGTNIVFTGIDDSKTYKMRYIPTTTDFSALTDYFTHDGTVTGNIIIDSYYLNYLVKALDVFYTQWDEVPNDEILADARFSRVLDELIRNIRKEPNALDLPDLSLIY